MNPFTQSAAALDTHRKLGAILPSAVFTLLNAHAPVEDPEPKPVKAAAPKPRKISAVPNAKHARNRAFLAQFLTDKPQTYKQLAAVSGMQTFTVRSTLVGMCVRKMAVNVGKPGGHGLYVLPGARQPLKPKGPFDV